MKLIAVYNDQIIGTGKQLFVHPVCGLYCAVLYCTQTQCYSNSSLRQSAVTSTVHS